MTDKAKGSVRKAVGQATGDRKTEAEGNLDKAKGEVKNTVGGIKDKLREEPLWQDRPGDDGRLARSNSAGPRCSVIIARGISAEERTARSPRGSRD